MDSYRWDEIQRLYHAALERPPGERAGFLEVACGEDSELRREVESLLAYEGQADELLEHSPWLPGETVETCAAGTKLGAYKVVRLLGRGGMGEVYLAEDPRLKRQVAIKALRHARTVTEQERARFLLEARAASALNHPNIVTVYDVLAEGGCDFIVMEYIPGGTLADRIARKALRLKQSLEIGARIADALACAHGAGIVHRDLKPSNVMIADDGAVKVLDFGVAKITRAGTLQDSGSTLTPPQTGAGVVVGTSGYMSPEQVCGRPVDHRSDIFSFALVLYEMLAGRRAFQGDSSFELMNAILKEEPPELPESVPPALRSLIGDCLAKDPAARFESARDLAFALRAFSTGSGASAGSLKIEEAPRRSLARWLMAAVAIVPAIVAAALYVTRPEPLDLSKYGFKPVATEAELESAGTWSPDGKSIAYLKNDIEGQRQVMVRALDAPSARQLTRLPAGIDGLPFFSPDGDHVYFIFSGSLRSVAVVGGDAREVLKGPMAAAAISPDGKTLAVWRSYEEGGKRHASVWISSPPGSTPRQYQPAPFRTEGSFVPDYVRFSPDGSKIGVAAWRRPAEAWMWLLPWPDGPNARPRQVLSEQGFRAVPSFDWMPDSRHLCFASGGLWLGDTRSGKCTRLTAFAAGVAALPSVSRDGRRVLFALSSSDLDVVEFPLDGSSLRPFIATTRNELSPSWSRSGDEMTYITDRSGEPEIWFAKHEDRLGEANRSPSRFPERAAAPLSVSLHLSRWDPDRVPAARTIVGFCGFGRAPISSRCSRRTRSGDTVVVPRRLFAGVSRPKQR